MHEAANCQKKSGSLVKRILGAAKFYENGPMKREKILEKMIFQHLAKKGYKIYKCGFKVIASNPIFGASPDGIGENFVVEIKCPISDKTFCDYLKDENITNKYKA